MTRTTIDAQPNSDSATLQSEKCVSTPTLGDRCNSIAAIASRLIAASIAAGCAPTMRQGPITLPIENDQVKIPVHLKGTGGWILINECTVQGIHYFEKSDLIPAAIPYAPSRGYGDKFWTQEYEGIDKDAFLRQAEIFQRLNIVYGQCPTEQMEKDTLSDNSSTDRTTRSLNAKQAADIVTATITALNSSGLKIGPLQLADGGNAKYPDGVLLKNYLDRLNIAKFKSLRSPARLIDEQAQTFNAYAYAARKKYSSTTLKTSTVYVTSESSFAQSLAASFYPTTQFNMSEDSAAFYDRWSLDIGVVKPTGGSGSSGFEQADNRYMVGLSFDVVPTVAFQTGWVGWSSGGKGDGSPFVGFSIDVLNALSTLGKN